MEVGTLKNNPKQKSRSKNIMALKNGFGGGNSNGGNSGGGEQPDFSGYEMTENYPSNIGRIFTMFLLLVVLMTFGGLMSAYIVIATNGVLEWRPFDLPVQVWISTAIILASSLTYHISAKYLKKNEQLKSKKWLLATTVLGAAFISSQILAWFQLYNHGVYMQSNPYAGFFYILTAVHVVHVFGGICALGTIVLRSWNKTFSDEELSYRKNLANVVGWYWHMMDCLWLIILFLLGFWK